MPPPATVPGPVGAQTLIMPPPATTPGPVGAQSRASTRPASPLDLYGGTTLLTDHQRPNTSVGSGSEPPPTAKGPAETAPFVQPHAATGLRGTMIGIAPPESTANSAVSGPPQPPANAAGLRGTMIGLAPVDRTPPPNTSAGQPAPATNLRGTMIGIGVPAQNPSSAPPAAAGPRGLESGTKTVLGVARPGIAPLNPGHAKHAPVNLGGGYTNTLSGPSAGPLTEGEEQAFASQVRKTRIPTLAAIAIAGAAALLSAGAVAWFFYKGHGAVEAHVEVGTDGHELLALACAQCPDDSVVHLDGMSAPFKAGHARLALARTLHIGDNPVEISFESRPGKYSSIILTVPVEYRVRGDVSNIDADPPELRVLVSAAVGSTVMVDGKPLPLGADGKGMYRIDVSDALAGPEATVQRLERRVKYSVTAPSANATGSGEILLQSSITPLVIDAPGPSVVLEAPNFVLSGRTVKGGTVSVGGRAITVNATGRFAQLMNVSAPGETTITVRASVKDNAPRLFPLRVRRVESLAREAEKLRQKAVSDYALIGPEAKRGASVAFDGTTVEASADDYASVILMDIKNGCPHTPCLARIRYGARSGLVSGDAFSVFGELQGTVEGPHAGTHIPEIRADFLLKGPP
jgi:hypothetical protein